MRKNTLEKTLMMKILIKIFNNQRDQMTNCEVCGAPIKQPKPTLFSKTRKYCSNKCRISVVRKNFKINYEK